MARLGRVSRTTSGGQPQTEPQGDAGTQQQIRDLYARGRRLYPAFALDETAFASHLARCGAHHSVPTDLAHVGDLFLAAAALSGDPRAVLELTRHCSPAVSRYTGRVTGASADLDDVAQELWKLLLMGTGNEPPKLAIYSGRGPLSAFVGITAQRIALRRALRADAATRAARAAVEMDALTLDPELSIVKESYRKSFQEAVAEALLALDDRARMVLRMHVVDRVSLERIARAYDVRQSSVSRWLEKARRQVAQDTYRALKARLQLSQSDLRSIRGLVASQLDMSISRLLRPA